MDTGCEYLRELEALQEIIDSMLLKLELLEESAKKDNYLLIIDEREDAGD